MCGRARAEGRYEISQNTYVKERFSMKHIQSLNKSNLKESAAKGGCGECQASCQSACKTSCTVANQKCEHEDK